MMIKLSLFLHIIGIVFWLGGLIILPRILAYIQPDADAAPLKAISRCFWGFVVPGMVLVLILGICQIFLIQGAEYYLRHGWFHGKLTVVLVLLVATFLLGREITRTTKGGKPRKSILMAIHGVSAMGLFLAVGLTLFLR